MEEPMTNSLHSPSRNDKHSDATAQCSVVAIYQTKIGGFPRNVTVIWCKSLINHTLSLSVERDPNVPFTCKVDIKPWPFWTKKGFKSFDIDGSRADIFWDLRSAKFSSGGGPEPTGGYYVALVYNDEVVLLIGDMKKEAYKKTKSRPSLEDAAPVSKRENVFGKKCFSTRARFDQRRKKEHDIVVENCISGPKDPEMWISIDGIVLIHVSNLQWKFRGNATVLVEGRVPLQVFWDVHAWLFGTPGVGNGLFIFKPAAGAELQVADEDRSNRSSNSSSSSSDLSSFRSCSDGGPRPEFCLFLYAWKME